MRTNRVDALVAPTTSPAWVTDVVLGDHFVGGSASSLPAVAGYPHITVPMGLVNGLPVGLSIIGERWSEEKLIGFAYAFEQRANARTPPRYVASVEQGQPFADSVRGAAPLWLTSATHRPRLLDILRKHRETVGTENPKVFPSQIKGRGISTAVGNTWKVVRARAELVDFRLHDLRHNAASVAVNGAQSCRGGGFPDTRNCST